ncbi:MAG: hypothetical protein IKE24_06005 [Clostridia bacterium]|nr:hypothetical protein [Clostridia bacterium]
MKRFLCVLVMLCLLVPAALAEETVALTWDDFAPVLEAAGVTGQFYTFDEIAVQIWLPDGMLPVELTEEDKANGYIGYFMPEDESAQMAVMYVDINGMSLEEYAQYLASEDSVTDVEAGTVNGFPCVSYKLPAQDSVSVTFTTEAGYALEVTCTPASEENAELVWGAVISSIQAAE